MVRQSHDILLCLRENIISFLQLISVEIKEAAILRMFKIY